MAEMAIAANATDVVDGRRIVEVEHQALQTSPVGAAEQQEPMELASAEVMEEAEEAFESFQHQDSMELANSTDLMLNADESSSNDMASSSSSGPTGGGGSSAYDCYSSDDDGEASTAFAASAVTAPVGEEAPKRRTARTAKTKAKEAITAEAAREAKTDKKRGHSAGRASKKKKS